MREGVEEEEEEREEGRRFDIGLEKKNRAGIKFGCTCVEFEKCRYHDASLL